MTRGSDFRHQLKLCERGAKICGALADDEEKSLILRQVFYGAAMRMACLDALLTRGE